MEPVVFDESPLAAYLRAEGEEEPTAWAPIETERESLESSPPSSPGFAPTGRPLVRSRFRAKTPGDLRVVTPSKPPINSLARTCSSAVASNLGRADNAKFLEQFRYSIIGSQLLSGHTILGQHHTSSRPILASEDAQPEDAHAAPVGTVVAVAVGLVAAAFIKSLGQFGAGFFDPIKITLLLLVATTGAWGTRAVVRRRNVRHQALAEVATFVTESQELDSATGAALALIQEVELVSRGYRISTPLPPISRIEDRTQARKCARLRKALASCFASVIESYIQSSTVIKGYSEQLDLEKYHDIYDISDLDISDALQGVTENEFDDLTSLRSLKILAARFHIIRKLYLCALLALDANSESTDALRWSAAVESLLSLNAVTRAAHADLRGILREEESFATPPTPKAPLTPGRERWRSQLRKLNSLSSGIRGLQAKLQLLKEESDKSLNESDDVTEAGPNLMIQYESIGVDLKALMQAWEEGKAALAQGIDRNEKRLSSVSTLLSPTTSLSGLTAVEEGGALEALQALNGELPATPKFGSPNELDKQEVFEAVAMPRPRSLLTREERIIRMREDREKREAAREKTEASKGMLRELEMVINLRPRARTNTMPSRIASA